MRRFEAYCGIILGMLINGCALLAQGTDQTIQVTSSPPGSTATLAGERVSPGGEVSISRRVKWRVLRAEHPGFVASCKLIPCPKNKLAVFFDSIPLAIPLAVDAILGTLHVCPDEVAIELEPERPGHRYAALPSDDEIYRAVGRRDGNLCDLHGASYLLVFAGEPPRQYEILGEVTVNAEDMRRYRIRMTPEGLDRVIRKKALETYGDQVDALIGTGSTFEGSRLGYDWKVGLRNEGAQGFARGLAVHFTGPESTPPAITPVTNRLRDLEAALRSGLITQDEFDRRKVELLDQF